MTKNEIRIIESFTRKIEAENLVYAAREKEAADARFEKLKARPLNRRTSW